MIVYFCDICLNVIPSGKVIRFTYSFQQGPDNDFDPMPKHCQPSKSLCQVCFEEVTTRLNPFRRLLKFSAEEV